MTSGDQVRVEPSQLSGKAADIGTPVNDVSGRAHRAVCLHLRSVGDRSGPGERRNAEKLCGLG